MTEERPGKVWRVGDNIDTDLLAPGLYMKRPIDELARHCLEAIEPRFAADVRPGDFLVAGRNFGMGSSREQAAEALRHLGIRAVLARSFAGIFYRNALNLGLLALVCPGVDRLFGGCHALLAADLTALILVEDGERIPVEPLPPHLAAMVADGGLIPHLELKLRSRKEGFA